MYWYLTTFSLLLLFAAAASTTIALYAWKRRPVPGSVLFAIAMLSITQWALAFLLHILSPDLPGKLAWLRFQYIGIVILPVAWVGFTLQYSGWTAKQIPQRLLFPALFSLMTFFLVLTSQTHGLFWRNIQMNTSGGQTLMTFDPGAWYWISYLFLYGCYLIGSLLIMTSHRYEIASLHSRQAFNLVVGLSLPWFGLALHVARLNVVNLMPLAFALSGIMVAYYALRLYYVDKTPLAQHVILNNLADGVLVVDHSQKIVDANLAAADILQRPYPDLINRPLTAVWPELAVQCKFDAEKPHDLVRLSQEGTRYYEAHISPLMDWRKLPSTNLVTLHDITQRKQTEALREDLTRSMVHDLRSPISNSLFALQMLRGGLEIDAASPDNQHLVDMTLSSTEKVLHLVNNILDVSRLEEGGIPVNRTAVSLAAMIEQVVACQMAHAAEKQIHIQATAAPDLPRAWVDAGLLERILQNLLDNSLKFSPIGGVIQVTAVAVPDIAKGKTHLEISVSDDGPGLSPELAQTVFDKFVTGSHKESGSGLGLAFCHMALAAHGEQIWASNNLEQGVTFTFSLPIAPTAYKDLKLETAVAPEIHKPFHGPRFAQPHPEIVIVGR
ncbi:MAG: PAS domain-containing protein [Chloroflexi bacterium]|nr:PAS domain-containing protein [Chloroflexota bacterium]